MDPIKTKAAKFESLFAGRIRGSVRASGATGAPNTGSARFEEIACSSRFGDRRSAFRVHGAPASGTARCGLFHHRAVLEAGAPICG